jgi:hypothetical protein
VVVAVELLAAAQIGVAGVVAQVIHPSTAVTVVQPVVAVVVVVLAAYRMELKTWSAPGRVVAGVVAVSGNGEPLVHQEE